MFSHMAAHGRPPQVRSIAFDILKALLQRTVTGTWLLRVGPEDSQFMMGMQAASATIELTVATCSMEYSSLGDPIDDEGTCVGIESYLAEHGLSDTDEIPLWYVLPCMFIHAPWLFKQIASELAIIMNTHVDSTEHTSNPFDVSTDAELKVDKGKRKDIHVLAQTTYGRGRAGARQVGNNYSHARSLACLTGDPATNVFKSSQDILVGHLRGGQYFLSQVRRLTFPSDGTTLSGRDTLHGLVLGHEPSIGWRTIMPPPAVNPQIWLHSLPHDVEAGGRTHVYSRILYDKGKGPGWAFSRPRTAPFLGFRGGRK